MLDKHCREVTVRGLTLDPVTNAPIVILKASGENRLLPIWIGLFEANAIAIEMEKIRTPRPMTHDLIRNLVDLMDARLNRVVVDNLRENTFYASVYLTLAGGEERRLDSRPSDAIAVALRAGAPIFVSDEVFTKAQLIELDESGDIGDREQWRQWLERIKPEDFGSYPRDAGASAPENDPGRADG